ncbi:Chemotaxis protein CheA [Planctomycetes bacterium CA13]|uniref:histidine kinase n=1 Tax=Novipirellula herctigrandis TaxID=2527986 RepID=A0A5C5YVP8_9BACT|nr:Chemotaxis protein CheA [Planctomycetes bacterium CA13]
MDDTELLNEFVEEAREHLGGIEMQLLQIEAMGELIDDDLVNNVFRAIHSVKGAAGFLGLTQINQVAHRLENVLGKVRDHQLIPDPFNVDVMLKGADCLRNLIESIDTSNETDNTALCEQLDAVLAGSSTDETVNSDKAAQTEQMVDAEESCEAAPTATATKTRKTRARKAANSKSSATTTKTTTTKTKTATAKRRRKAAPAKKQAAQAEASLESVESAVNDAVNVGTTAKPAATETSKSKSPPSKPAAKKAPGNGNGPDSPKKTTSPQAEATIRVGVRVLDRLMNLAGELVLSRNQLLRALNEQSRSGTNLDAIANGLDQVTTELQTTIMQTRMQPIGNVFNKFPRVIRDLSASLNKQINLKMEGNDVEVDKTIVEAIADPLTHLVRNSCDHGIELPQDRIDAQKPAVGTVELRAFHQAGKVVIEIVDDGGGMDPSRLREIAVAKGMLSAEAAEQLTDRDAINQIFAPGFSTAKEVSNVSGRGVGMDVVRTNIEQIGGAVEIESELGSGSTIRITLPLTLAIVPSMIVSVDNRRYALPQTNIVELVQTDGREKRIERVNQAEVLRLRGNLIPLVRVSDTLKLIDETDPSEEGSSKQECQLVVVEAGRRQFALAVDRVLDSEEIVVKPLGRHLSNLPLLAGSTILGDGRVAMILDAAGISSQVKLTSDSESSEQTETSSAGEKTTTDVQRLVLLSVGPEDHFAISMDIVSRIERVAHEAIERVGKHRVLQYRGGTLPLVSVDEVVPVNSVDETKFVHVIVFKVYGHEVGLIAPNLYDIRKCDLLFGDDTCRADGVAGIAVIDERPTRLLDLYGLTQIARPEWFSSHAEDQQAKRENTSILVCEDSPFFRNFLSRMLQEEGYQVSSFEHGEAGWASLSEHPGKYDLLLTDVEMPELDGVELTRRVRADGRFETLPIIALTSLADEESVQRGREAGVDDYQVKMNKPDLLASITKHTSGVQK